LEFGLAAAALRVAGEHGIDIRGEIGAAGGEARLDFVGLFTKEADVEHGRSLAEGKFNHGSRGWHG
jgi:hypothetical protein